ncbi:family 20 glycosylhydrolase [Lacihabitans soyangensis]|uniref:family 20 glycosylhydrolase n=1 Tax=Lacihabitans soyangensis TaxID=869394 RepID=UPI0020CE9AC0|nr:family 20 glycosylhydrolase [Lacihabitans soyangensis]
MKNTNELEKLTIKWQLIKNPEIESGTNKSAFTFINSGTETIKTGKWSLYFNQSFLKPIQPDNLTKGKIEHLNGDLYRYVPDSSFTLSQGDSLFFEYEAAGILFNEKYAPQGAYIVYDDSKIITKDLNIAPITDYSNIFSDSAFVATIPNAANQYLINQNIPVLPSDKIGKIIPSPYSIKSGKGGVILDKSTTIYYSNVLKKEAEYLVSLMEKYLGTKLKIKEGNGTEANSITIKTAPLKVNDVSAEAYSLSVAEEKGVVITGNDAAGVFYGIQSLSALVPAINSAQIKVESVEILDAPRFSFRSFLLDVSRNFAKKDDVLRLIDLLAMYKINKLNLHLSEDEGWRLEINGLPELTQIGSKRGHTIDSKNWLTPSYGSGPYPDSENNYGKGFYSREEFKDIIKYADQRHIQVIPEISMPGHARAAIKAMEARYDYYMAKGETEKAKEFRLIDPNDKSVYLSAQMYKDNIVCVALPSVYHFYETVVKDIVAMYQEAGLKLTTFNTGGDEVPNGAWAKSPLCIELMKTLPEIKDARQLQGYFLEKALAIFEKYDLEVAGWEEIVLNKDSQNNIQVNPKFKDKKVLPLVWDNTGKNIDLGYRIANAGYKVVLCNATNLYFDLSYNSDPTEPGLVWAGYQDAIDPYVMTPFDVFKSINFDKYSRLTEKEEIFGRKSQKMDANMARQHLKVEAQKNIVGMQAQLWSETIKGPKMLEYYLAPKLFAFAEKSWSNAPVWENESNISKRVKAIWAGWADISNQIGQREFPRLDFLFGGYNYRIAPPGAVLEDGILKANIAFPGLTIRYTEDGSEPGINSKEYTNPIKVNGLIKVRAFNKFGRASKTFIVK